MWAAATGISSLSLVKRFPSTPDRLGATCQVAATRLGGLEHLLGLAPRCCAQLVSLTLGGGTLLLALAPRCLARLLGLALRSIPGLLSLAQGRCAQLVGLLLGLL